MCEFEEESASPKKLVAIMFWGGQLPSTMAAFALFLCFPALAVASPLDFTWLSNEITRPAPGTGFQLYACTTADKNQIFSVDTASGNIVSAATKQCLTAVNGVAGEGPIALEACTASANQSFTFEANGHVLLAANAGTCSYGPCTSNCCECFNVNDGGRSPGTPVTMWPCANPPDDNEKFWFEPATGLIHGNQSGLCLGPPPFPLPLLASHFQV